MDRKKVVKSAISILENLSYDNDTILVRQLASVMELIDCVGIDITGTEKPCNHPEDKLINLSTMGADKQSFQCMECNEIIYKEWE